MKVRARAIGQAMAAWVAVAAMAVTAPVSLKAQEQRKRAITFQDLISMHRLSEPQISPDGKWIAYAVSTPDLEANKCVRNIWNVFHTGREKCEFLAIRRPARPRIRSSARQLPGLASGGGHNPDVSHAFVGFEVRR